MPIYAYRCDSCGYEKDILRKVSDPLLTVCPACQADTFRKQVTAAGFQLKGSGWYATDFRGGSKPKGTDEASGAATSDSAEAGKTDAAPAADKPVDKAAAPAPAAAAAPSTASKSSPPTAGAGSS